MNYSMVVCQHGGCIWIWELPLRQGTFADWQVHPDAAVDVSRPAQADHGRAERMNRQPGHDPLVLLVYRADSFSDTSAATDEALAVRSNEMTSIQ